MTPAQLEAWKAAINARRSPDPHQGPSCERRADRPRQNISQVVTPGKVAAFDGDLPEEFLRSVFAAARESWRGQVAGTINDRSAA